ncbi:hypothetical protein [Rickettsiella endosymbiont of Dermanyssus gallinae]|uniref:hypothetical protein n=1 Tax=Rickettsiella endosymbiont of Dermanyssus gallinae TaxID=2856608 RepID=UPI001C5300AF|nr:hypothetical protein [Rickettsiella endosymbiont of Dermanyssus gallinae]
MPSTPNTSNFITFAPTTGGLTGTAGAIFTASTEDDEATITKAGYINDLFIRKVVKDYDVILINYASGKNSALFSVKNMAKEGDPPQAQLIKVAEPKPPTPPK